MVADELDVVVGVDTHKHTHTAAALRMTGAVIDHVTVPADPAGYRRLIAFGRRHGNRRLWAVEGTGSFGAGLCAALLRNEEPVVEVDRPQRPARRAGSKSDDIDAVRAARQALAGIGISEPRCRGDREAIRVLLTTRAQAIEFRTRAISALLPEGDRNAKTTALRPQQQRKEGDLIVGANNASAVATLVERSTRLVRLLHLPQRDGDTLHDALRARLGLLPTGLRRSITWDQGTEMARHLAITETLGAPVYFCDSRSPWQRGSNDNTNGLLRDYFPKGTDLSVHSAGHLLAVENELNSRPRRVLNDRSPAELFEALLTSQSQSVSRR